MKCPSHLPKLVNFGQSWSTATSQQQKRSPSDTARTARFQKETEAEVSEQHPITKADPTEAVNTGPSPPRRNAVLIGSQLHSLPKQSTTVKIFAASGSLTKN